MAGVSALLLAAGAGRRFRGVKQLLKIDGEPMVRRTAKSILDAGLELTVVTGAYRRRVDRALHGLPLIRLHHPGWAAGMGSSLAAGVRTLSQRADPPQALILCLADQPAVGATELRRLLMAWRQHPDAIVLSDHGAARGPPALFPRCWFDALAALGGDHGARDLIRRCGDAVVTVAMPEAAFDIDTREDVSRWPWLKRL